MSKVTFKKVKVHRKRRGFQFSWKKILLFVLGALILFYLLISILNKADIGGSGNVIYEEQENSVKTAEIRFAIEITDAKHLDSEKKFVSDISNEVKYLDNVWSKSISDGEYVRVVFEQNITNRNDIKVYPRIVSGNPKIEVYEKDGNNLIAEFSSLTSNQYNQILLTNLQNPQDSFDLKILDGSVEFDHIIDPAWNVSSAVWDGPGSNLSLTGQDGFVDDFFINSSGTRMFVTGDNTGRVFQYTLSQAWNTSTATWDGPGSNFSITGQDTTPLGIFFNSTGTRMFMLGNQNKRVYQYTLSQAWNTSTATWDGPGSNFSVSQDTFVSNIFFSSNGTKMFITGDTNDRVYQYTLSQAWICRGGTGATGDFSQRQVLRPHQHGASGRGVALEHEANTLISAPRSYGVEI